MSFMPFTAVTLAVFGSAFLLLSIVSSNNPLYSREGVCHESNFISFRDASWFSFPCVTEAALRLLCKTIPTIAPYDPSRPRRDFKMAMDTTLFIPAVLPDSGNNTLSLIPQFAIFIGDERAISHLSAEPDLVYHPIICAGTPPPGEVYLGMWYTTPIAEGSAQIFSQISNTSTFAVVARGDQVVTVPVSEGVSTVWSIRAIDGDPNFFTIRLPDQDLVWTLGKGNRIVLRTPEGLPEQKIEFFYFKK
ncbi:hypothetical protein P691DRAFT_781092 [Macrolepiota fuliginosa MF-IS2]|uniref:Uncharacterized protein n=1 Tax=Macrolepiota fuliginosa MF-IS2 TaxID=1400762 RepID=A0A9P6C4F8_9AGAR|nr:hypothetical protein P691DRAFT_781092 [Macrolepiota fuliginosa MF-IS2]